MEERDTAISMRRGRLTLPAHLRRQADLPDDGLLHVRLHEGAFVLYRETPSFLRPRAKQPSPPPRQEGGAFPVAGNAESATKSERTGNERKTGAAGSTGDAGTRFESAVGTHETLMLRALESIPARDLEGFCAETVRLLMSDLRLMGAGITIFDRHWRVSQAAFTTLDGYLSPRELLALKSDARQILRVVRQPAWITEPWCDPRVALHSTPSLPYTSCVVAPVFTSDGFAALLFGFGRRVETQNAALVETFRRMAERIAVSLHPHLSAKATVRESWRPLADAVLCRDCAKWVPLLQSHRPASAAHHERYCDTCWDLRCSR